MRSRTWLASTFLFGSGFCALVYQIAWLREFRLIFGASTVASAAVLAIFIGGLGVGGVLLGPRADGHPRPLRLYAQLEGIVAISAALTPFLLMLVQSAYLASGGSTRLGWALATIVRLVLSALVLAVPTIAMGGTLPAAARAATRAGDDRRKDLAALYAFNTLGAVVGCLAATFWLMEPLGTRSTLWLAAAVNAVLAATAYLASPSFAVEATTAADGVTDGPVAHPENAAQGTSATGVRDSRSSRTCGTKGQPASPDPPAAPRWFLLTASAVVGFAFFLMELVWYRMLSPLLGGSVFTFGLVLAVALTGVGIGGLVYALAASDRQPSLVAFGWTCLVESAAVAAAYALGDRIAMFAATLLPLEGSGFGARVVAWSLVTMTVVLAPALAAGYQFPLLIALFGRARAHIGRQVGLAYAANTAGAVAGSLAGGFGLIPWLGATGAWRLVALALLALGATAAGLASVDRRQARGLPRALGGQGLLALLVLLGVMATGPTAVWRHSGIGAGRMAPGQVLASPNRFHEWASSQRANVVWEGDGTESSVALVRSASGYAFFVNGKSDGNARSDAGTQVMLGLLGALMHPNPRNALVIGLGTGSSVGWLAAVPSIARVDVVELEPLILEVARACAPVNRDVLQNAKVHVTLGDARETLRTSRDTYDVIASEPSNPYRAGVASLFTAEYYRAAAERLSDDGVFVQWVQGYEIDARTIRAIYATLGAVFPQVETWHTNPGDIVLVASKRRHTYVAADLARRIAAEPYRDAIASVWRAVDLQGLLAHYVANDRLTRALAAMPDVDVNTDDRNVVEFGLARSVGSALTTVVEIRNAAASAGAARPPIEDDPRLDWAKVETARVAYNASVGSFADTRPEGPPLEQARQAALVNYFRNGDLGAARVAWAQQADGPRDLVDLAVMADILASSGSEAALPLLGQLRTFRPAEADVLVATLRVVQGRHQDAAAALQAGFTGFRADPWSHGRYIERAIQLAETLAEREPGLARPMFDALGAPFSVLALDAQRLMARAMMTGRSALQPVCGEAVSALEPHVPWTEPFLRLRRACYRSLNDPQQRAADRDLTEYLSHAAQPLLAPTP